MFRGLMNYGKLIVGQSVLESRNLQISVGSCGASEAKGAYSCRTTISCACVRVHENMKLIHKKKIEPVTSRIIMTK